MLAMPWNKQISIMDQHQGVKVVEACQVAPLQGSITSSTTPTSLPLTYFDLLSLEFKPVRQLFFYEFPHPTTSFFDSVVPNLKHSLQLTLQHFLPLAGTLTWPHDSPYPVINYVPGDVVPFIVAESVANNFNTLCSNLCETVARHPLIPHLSIISHEKVSLLALQVTLFPNNGFCIGITIGHGAADGNSAALFINAWAYICSKLIDSTSPSSPLSLSLPEHLTPFFDRSVITDRTTIIPEAGGPKNRSVKRWEWKNHATQVDTVKGLFELTPWHVQNLKQYARSKLKTKLRISTFSVACACALSCMVKAEQEKSERVAFVIHVDCRSRLNPPIPTNYFGNCVGGLVIVAETKDLLGNDGFINALKGIIEALNRVVEDAVPTPVESWNSKLQPFMNERVVSLFGSPQFEVYSVDFGWGRPKIVDRPGIDEARKFSFSESGKGGFEICITFSIKEMEAFAQHFAQTLKSFGCSKSAE